MVWYSHLFKNFPQFLQARLQQYINRELLDVQAGFRKRQRISGEIKLPTYVGSSKKQESSRKTSALLARLQTILC